MDKIRVAAAMPFILLGVAIGALGVFIAGEHNENDMERLLFDFVDRLLG